MDGMEARGQTWHAAGAGGERKQRVSIRGYRIIPGQAISHWLADEKQITRILY